jgi:hypothetical protein
MSASSSTTAAPTDQQESTHTKRSQCDGRPSRILVPGSASRSSTRKLDVLATQLAVVTPLSSTRSPVASS